MVEMRAVRIGGNIAAYRPVDDSTPKTTARKAAKKQATTKRSASTAEEATK